MKTIKYIVMSALVLLSLASCNDYLEIYPENVEPSDKFWQSKEDVESALYSGYYFLRSSVEDNLIPWGELRAGCVYDRRGSVLQRLEIKPTNNSLVDWGPMYKIVNVANLVLANAEKARGNDRTYTEEEMHSHMTEAYFLRALAYFYIVRNWRDAPLITDPFETDEMPQNVPQSSDTLLIAQIKSDLQAAINLNAAKEVYNTTWETKGRATIWAIYALAADVNLWDKQFDTAIQYCDLILNARSANAPRFMSTNTHASWFSIFNPGNSNESIFEVQWSHEKLNGTSYQTNNLPDLFNDHSTNTSIKDAYAISDQMTQDFNQDYMGIIERYPENYTDMAVRTMYGGYFVGSNAGAYMSAHQSYVWKYVGGTTTTEKRTTTYYDPNYIIYRVADIMLMKAEALVMRHLGTDYSDNQEAIRLVNQIRERTNLEDREIYDNTDFKDIMDYVLYEELMEFVGEGKAWYDLLRVGRYTDPSGIINFKRDFLIEYVVKYNSQASETWINSVLSDENAWYLPVSDNEIKTNGTLVQNPYYL